MNNKGGCMETTIELVAEIVSLYPALKNYMIESINKKHQLSGLRMLRLLKQMYYETIW